jgi:hypothetical protein
MEGACSAVDTVVREGSFQGGERTQVDVDEDLADKVFNEH